MTDPVGWLDRQDPPAPPSVRKAIDEQLAGTDPVGELPERLAAAAIRALAAVVAEPSDRRTATTLLAADALLTYACQAAAEAGPEGLARLTDRLSVQRFSDLIPDGP